MPTIFRVGGGGGKNIRVKISPTLPSTGQENDIVIVGSEEVGDVLLGAVETIPEGKTLIETRPKVGPTLSIPYETLTLNLPLTGAIRQENGSRRHLTAYLRQDGEWVQFSRPIVNALYGKVNSTTLREFDVDTLASLGDITVPTIASNYLGAGVDALYACKTPMESRKDAVLQKIDRETGAVIVEGIVPAPNSEMVYHENIDANADYVACFFRVRSSNNLYSARSEYNDAETLVYISDHQGVSIGFSNSRDVKGALYKDQLYEFIQDSGGDVDIWSGTISIYDDHSSVGKIVSLSALTGACGTSERIYLMGLNTIYSLDPESCTILNTASTSALLALLGYDAE